MGDRLDQAKITDQQDWLDSRRDIIQSGEINRYAYKLTFGRVSGRQITDVPSSYLIWLRHNTTIAPLIERCSDELERRRRIGRHTTGRNFSR